MASITKRGDTWQAKVYYYDENGIRHAKSKSGFKTQSEAKYYALDIQKRSFDGVLKIDSDTYFPEYFWNWFQTYKESNVTIRTKRTYQQVHNVLKKYFKDVAIGEITRRQYQQFLKKYGTTHARSTVSKNNSLIHACIKDALYDDVITKDFIENTSLVFDKKRTRSIEYLNIKEMNILATYLAQSLNYHFTGKYMILLAIYTGMRLGEIQGLKWKDINFKFKAISIKRAWNETDKEFKDTKNESSVRIIRVNADIIKILKELHDQIRPNDNDQVFLNQYQTVPTSSAVNKTLSDCLDATNIDLAGFHFHSLRHTHVAYLLANDTNIYVISKRLGHADVGTTTRVYSYLIDEYKARTDNEIEGVLDKINLTTKSDDEASVQ